MSDGDLEKLMNAEEMQNIGINKLTESEKASLYKWGMRCFEMGMHICEDIEEIKYGGRLVILADGSRWEIDEIDSDIVSAWGELAKVVVINGEMYLLDENERVNAEQEF